jgi:hypothetical protein
MKALPLLVGATVLTATVLFLTGNVRPKSVYPPRDGATLCNEVFYELQLYEPSTDTLSVEQVNQIINRCRRRFVK